MRTFEEIRTLCVQLQNRRTPLLQYMMEIKRHYEADWVVPMPDVKGEPKAAQFTPSLITDTIDALGMRASSTSPVTYCPATRQTATAQGRALQRRKILNGTYHDQKWKVKERRYYRHLCAYDTSSIFVEPDFKRKRITLNVRDPLFTYPEPKSAETVTPPEYVAYITRFSGEYLRKLYPKIREENGGPISSEHGHEEWDILEWVDTEQFAYGLLGPRSQEGKHIASQWSLSTTGDMSQGPWMPLAAPVRNLAGVCPAVTPQEISLHSVGTRLNALLGNVEMQTQLMAMEVMAQQRAVFPDMFVIGSENDVPRIAGGEWADGRTGRMNMLSGVQQVGQISQTPDQRTSQLIDRLERNTRVSAGLNPQMGGESFGSLRTGRALDSMMASSVDPRIQELHEVTEAWMPAVNTAILEQYKAYFPEDKIVFFSGWRGDKGLVEFVPKDTIDNSENIVTYSIPGADAIQLTQVLGSLYGSGAISLETFRSLHPYIDDPESERAEMVQEDVFKAMLAGAQEQIASGQMPIAIVAKLYKAVREGKSLEDAIVEADEEIKAAQAEAQQAAMEGAGNPADPMAQLGLAAGPGAAAPGMAPPGAGGPPPLAPGGPTPDMQAMLAGALGGA